MSVDGSASVRADATVSLVVLIIIIGMLCGNLKDRRVGVSDLGLSAAYAALLSLHLVAVQGKTGWRQNQLLQLVPSPQALASSSVPGCPPGVWVGRLLDYVSRFHVVQIMASDDCHWLGILKFFFFLWLVA